MSSELSISRDAAVTWVGAEVGAVEPAIRASWEAHVFHPGDRVTVDPDLDAAARARFATLVDYARTAGTTGLTVRNTIVSVSSQSNGLAFKATCIVNGCDEIWPHETLVDVRPIDRISGAVVTRGVSSWLIPLLDGSVMQRNYDYDPVALKPRLERRAQFALGAERIRDLPPLYGEFLVARGRGETGSLFAALWTSPLSAGEYAGIDVMLDDIRSESYPAVRHREPLMSAPHRLVVVQ